MAENSRKTEMATKVFGTGASAWAEENLRTLTNGEHLSDLSAFETLALVEWHKGIVRELKASVAPRPL